MPSIAQLERLLETDPEDAFVLFGLAMEHAKTGAHPAALEYFDRAIAADPTNSYHHFHKARSLESLDRTPEAAAVLREGLGALQDHPDPKAASELSGYLAALESGP
jgi:tetratricopeptide (TPR) repeat protein